MDIFSDQFAGYLRQMLHGAVITIELFMSGFVLALIFGTAAGITGSVSQSMIVQGIYRVYLSIITGVPSLLIIFLAMLALWWFAWAPWQKREKPGEEVDPDGDDTSP